MLLPNGAVVTENHDGSSPADSEMLATTLRPEGRRIFRKHSLAAPRTARPAMIAGSASPHQRMVPFIWNGKNRWLDAAPPP